MIVSVYGSTNRFLIDCYPELLAYFLELIISFGSTLYDRRIVFDVVAAVVGVPINASFDNNIVLGAISILP